MQKKLQTLQIGVLAGGSLFAWYTVFNDFGRYFAASGKIFDFSGSCRFPNPLMTPCFYGAIAFLICLGWAINNFYADSFGYKNQKNLNYLIIACNLFAWGNFSNSLYKFYRPRTGIFYNCSGLPATNPFSAPCFYGASVYLFSLIISLIILQSLKKFQENKK